MNLAFERARHKVSGCADDDDDLFTGWAQDAYLLFKGERDGGE